MQALIVGADHIDPIREEFARFGFNRTEHWSGRKVGDIRRIVPESTGLVVILCDRISHPLLQSVRKQAQRRGLPLIYCRHSLVDMRDKLASLAHAG